MNENRSTLFSGDAARTKHLSTAVQCGRASVRLEGIALVLRAYGFYLQAGT